MDDQTLEEAEPVTAEVDEGLDFDGAVAAATIKVGNPENQGIYTKDDPPDVDESKPSGAAFGFAGAKAVPVAAVEDAEKDDQPSPKTSEQECGAENVPSDEPYVPTEEEIASRLRYQRADAIGNVARSNQGRGIPIEILCRQAEDLMLWLDGEVTADELTVYNEQ